MSLYVHSPAASAQRRALAERNLRPAYPSHLRAYIQREKLMQSELYRSIFAEGEQQGERKGLQQGLRQAIMDLCEILGIELTPERRAEIEQLDPTQLSQLRTHLKSARAWPLVRP